MNQLMIKMIRFYQVAVSPLMGRNKCKYVPTCSNYALASFKRYRFITAFALTVWRILRCNPFSKGGVDFLR